MSTQQMLRKYSVGVMKSAIELSIVTTKTLQLLRIINRNSRLKSLSMAGNSAMQDRPS